MKTKQYVFAVLLICNIFSLSAIQIEYKQTKLSGFTAEQNPIETTLELVGYNTLNFLSAPKSEWQEFHWESQVGMVSRVAPSGVQLPKDYNTHLDFEIISSLVDKKDSRLIKETYIASTNTQNIFMYVQQNNGPLDLYLPQVVMSSMPSMINRSTASTSFVQPLQTEYGFSVRRVGGGGGPGGLNEDEIELSPVNDALPMMLLLALGYAFLLLYRLRKSSKISIE